MQDFDKVYEDIILVLDEIEWLLENHNVKSYWWKKQGALLPWLIKK
jgi:hypothetical protein